MSIDPHELNLFHSKLLFVIIACDIQVGYVIHKNVSHVCYDTLDLFLF